MMTLVLVKMIKPLLISMHVMIWFVLLFVLLCVGCNYSPQLTICSFRLSSSVLPVVSVDELRVLLLPIWFFSLLTWCIWKEACSLSFIFFSLWSSPEFHKSKVYMCIAHQSFHSSFSIVLPIIIVIVVPFKKIFICFVSSFSGVVLNHHGPEGEENVRFLPNNGRAFLHQMEDLLKVVSSFWRKPVVGYVIKKIFRLTWGLIYSIQFFNCELCLYCISLILSWAFILHSAMQGVDPSIRAEVWPFLLGV